MSRFRGTLPAAGLLLVGTLAAAQGPDGRPGPGGPDDLVARMLDFDKDKDGKLTKAEVTDPRLSRLFDRADADKDGTVTKSELTALAAKERVEDRGGFGGPGGPGGPSGPSGPMMGMPRPGEVLPGMIQQRLKLTAEQKEHLKVLQTEVDARLDKILTGEQKAALKEMRDRGPGGFGPPGGGRRPPGGGPPGGGGPPPPPPGDRPD